MPDYGLDGVVKGFKFLIWWGVIMGILGAWKLVDIAVWLYQHISFSWI